MLLHVTNEPLDRSHPESKDFVRHETILGKILFYKDFNWNLLILFFRVAGRFRTTVVMTIRSPSERHFMFIFYPEMILFSVAFMSDQDLFD